MNALDLASELIRRRSPSEESNAAVSDYVQEVLEATGFTTERLVYEDGNGVSKVNVLGKKGEGVGGLSFLGHTDTVPAENWSRIDPFEPELTSDKLYGRGSCDMKGPVACALVATGEVAASDLRAPLYVVCTADEEIGYGGAKDVVARSKLFQELKLGNGVITEPTMMQVVYAHKGCIAFFATARGRAAHSSTNEGVNANLAIIPFLAEMKKIHDELQHDPAYRNDEFSPPTPGWNIGINDGNTALNVTAPRSRATVYFRPMPGTDSENIVGRVRECADRCGLELELRGTAATLYTDPKSDYVKEVMRIMDTETAQTVPYGTDGLAFGNHMPLVVLGPGDIAQAHTTDEWISLEQLEIGTDRYRRLIQSFCLG